MSTKHIAQSTLWQVASQVVMAALSIVTVKLVAVGLSKELAGYYNTSYGFLQIFGILADFGLYAVAVRMVSGASDKERSEVFGALYALRIVITGLSLGTAILLAWVLPAWHGTPLPLAISIAALVPGFTLMAGMLRVQFQVHYKMRPVFIAEVTQRILTVTLIGLLVITGARLSSHPQDLYLFLGAGGLGAIWLFGLSLYQAKSFASLKPHWDKVLAKKIFKQALPYGLAFLATTLYRQTDVTLIGLLRPDFAIQNAMYGFVQRAMDMAYLFPTFLLNSTLPILSARDAKGEDTKSLLGKTFFIILLLGSTMFLFSFFWSRPLMQLLTTDAYLSHEGQPGSDTALKLLSVSMFFNGIMLYCFYTLLTKHRWKPLVAILAGGAVVSLISNLLLIPSQGFVGAAHTSMLVHVLLSASLLPLSFKTMPLRLPLDLVWRWVAYCLGLEMLLFGLAPMLHSSLDTAGGLLLGALWIGVMAWILKLHKKLL